MKVTFIEEIEVKKAFWPSTLQCKSCHSFCYEIHHQTEPKDDECWWVKCSECGKLGPETPTKELALSAWKCCNR